MATTTFVRGLFTPNARVLCEQCVVPSSPWGPLPSKSSDPFPCDWCGAMLLTMRIDVNELANMRDRLRAAGVRCTLDQTGGMGVALHIYHPGGWLWVTFDGGEWRVGLYARDEPSADPVCYMGHGYGRAHETADWAFRTVAMLCGVRVAACVLADTIDPAASTMPAPVLRDWLIEHDLGRVADLAFPLE